MYLNGLGEGTTEPGLLDKISSGLDWLSKTKEKGAEIERGVRQLTGKKKADVVTPDYSPTPKKSNMLMYVGIGAVVLLGGGLVWSVIRRRRIS